MRHHSPDVRRSRSARSLASILAVLALLGLAAVGGKVRVDLSVSEDIGGLVSWTG